MRAPNPYPSTILDKIEVDFRKLVDTGGRWPIGSELISSLIARSIMCCKDHVSIFMMGAGFFIIKFS
jgi:hypothetical protein